MNKNNRKVTKAKILDAGTNVCYSEEIEKDDTVVPIHHDVNSTHQPTDHFRDAVEKLKQHYAIILGFAKVGDFGKVSDDVLRQIKITGINRKGDGDAEGVMITGMIRCLTKSWTAVNTPYLNFMNNDAYKHAGDLFTDANNTVVEHHFSVFLFRCC